MKRKQQIFDPEEMNKIIECAFKYTKVLKIKYEDDKQRNKHSLTDFSYFTYFEKNVTLTTSWYEHKPCTYVFTLDGESVPLKQGSECYGIFQRAAKDVIPSLRKDPLLQKMIGFRPDTKAFANKQAGYLYYNNRYDKQTIYVYGYDLNSAYLSVLYKKIPDTREIAGRNRKIEDGEVGFIFDSCLTLIDKPGLYADIIFKEIETPKSLKDYCERWYKRKLEKNPEAKQQIVNAIGYLQYHNPYVRSYIVSKCNNYIQSLKSDETTVLCNTDAIYSTVPLDDKIQLGTALGQFKADEGYITIDKLNYKSEVFGDKERGKVKNIKYKVIGDRIYGKESYNGR